MAEPVEAPTFTLMDSSAWVMPWARALPTWYMVPPLSAVAMVSTVSSSSPAKGSGSQAQPDSPRHRSAAHSSSPSSLLIWFLLSPFAHSLSLYHNISE